jgi:hypothetical protein
MRRVGAAAAGCALWQVSAEATGYVGGESHFILLPISAAALTMARRVAGAGLWVSVSFVVIALSPG